MVELSQRWSSSDLSKIYESYPISLTLFKQIGLVRLDSRLTQIIKTEMPRESLRLPSFHRRLLKVPAVEALYTPPRKSRPSHANLGFQVKFCGILYVPFNSKPFQEWDNKNARPLLLLCLVGPKKEVLPISPPQRKGTFTFLSSPFFGMILFSLLGAAPSCFFCWKKVCFPWKLIPLNKKNTF